MYAKIDPVTLTLLSRMASLPESTDDVSNFNLLPTSEQVARGYVPLTDVPPAYDPDTQALSAPTYTVTATGVTANYTVVALTAAEMAANLQAAQTAQVAKINDAAQAAFLAIVSSYPPEEVSTWPNQYSEAQAYTANPAAPTPTLSAIATGAGLTVAQVAAIVLQKAAAYTAASGAIVGKRKLLTSQILAATLPSQVQTIIW